MPRKPRGEVEAVQADDGSDRNSGVGLGEDSGADDLSDVEALAEVAEEDRPTNRRDPKPEQEMREAAMAGKGELPLLKIYSKRLAPDKVRHPSGMFMIKIAGQDKRLEGQLTNDEIERLLREYYGGGLVRVVCVNEDAKKTIWNKTVEFPGEVNMENVLADCMTSDQKAVLAGQPAVAGTPMLPGPIMHPAPLDPVKQIEQEAKLEEAEAKKMEITAEAKGRKAAAERRMRQLDRQARQEEERERFAENGGDDGFEFAPPGGSLMPRPFGPRGGFSRFGPPLPEMDQPITTKDMMVREQMSELKEQNRRLEAKLEHAIEQSAKPKGDTKDMIVALAAALGPVVGQMMSISAENNRAQRQSQDGLLKIMFESGNKQEKQMELLMQAMGLKDAREGKNTENFIELVRLGSELGGGAEPESIVTQIGRAGADLLGGVVSAFQAAKAPGPGGPPPQVRVPPALPAGPARPAAVPIPGQTAGQLPARPAQPALPANPPPAPAAPVTPAVQSIMPAPEEPGMTDADLRKLAGRLLDDAAAEVQTKPDNPKWVATAWEEMPDEWIEAVALSQSYKDLVELVQPYVPMHKAMGLLPVLKGDPAVQGWLEKGFAKLQAMCREEVTKKGPEDKNEPEAVPEESFGGEGME